MPNFGRARGDQAAPADPNATINANAATPGRGRFPQGPILSTQPLRELLSPELAAALAFGTSPDGSAMGPDDFATHQSVTLELPPGASGQMAELQLGKGHGTLKTGRILDYLDRGNDHRKICSLHLSLMDRMGVHLDRFGDANTRLGDL